MRRLVVLGGFGFFGKAVVEALRAEGLSPLVGSRRAGADVAVDVENRDSLAAALRPGDVLIDAVGPFQRRTTLLVEAAIELHCDVIDIADSLEYVAAVYRLRPQIDAAGIRVLSACSSMSTVSAAMIQHSGIAEPVCMSGCLVPATRHSAVAGTAASLFCSVGRTIQVLAGGRLAPCDGWRKKRTFELPAPLGRRTGRLFESADAITLPAVWPSLASVEFYVDTNVLGLNTALDLSARISWLRAIVDKLQRPGVKLSRFLGREASGICYEIAGRDGETARLALIAPRHGYLIAVAPSVLAALQLVNDTQPLHGLIPPDRHVPAAALLDYLQQRGIEFIRRGD